MTESMSLDDIRGALLAAYRAHGCYVDRFADGLCAAWWEVQIAAGVPSADRTDIGDIVADEDLARMIEEADDD